MLDGEVRKSGRNIAIWLFSAKVGRQLGWLILVPFTYIKHTPEMYWVYKISYSQIDIRVLIKCVLDYHLNGGFKALSLDPYVKFYFDPSCLQMRLTIITMLDT